MMRCLIALLLAAGLTGCATGGGMAPESRELGYAASPESTLRQGINLLADQGYVIRHADAELGRAEAVLSRWPGYRVQLSVTAEGEGARASLTATRGGRPLPPHLLDPLLAALESRLGLGPWAETP
ncbi:hypothetical protein HOP52_18410 [Halomonas campisalis]|uniref:Lipoprotein n=1 Tax=Billgrantia campisalis TaxID=74661 RepID=A0ABS9PDI8_9GAMM|nr:hypothetical protein [Halomonas campisalis]MCG6659726.1 hypothetical protein [Halomonas campisalis]MDR5864640.1 hypothetical protein [Halomonas campisalis]